MLTNWETTYTDTYKVRPPSVISISGITAKNKMKILKVYKAAIEANSES